MIPAPAVQPPANETPHTPVILPPRFFFGVSIACALFFGVWTLIVRPFDAEPPTFDASMRARFEANDSWWQIMVFFTDLGGIAAMTIVPIMGAFWQNAIKHRHVAIAWLLVVLGGGMLNIATKSVFDRARPANPHRVVHETNASYPSGHAMGSAIGYGMLAYVMVLPQPRRPRRIATIIFLTCVVLGIGISRVYLRAHWLSDVIAGWSIGLAWLSLCIGVMERRRRRALLTHGEPPA